ncbi:hypothetical protein FQZ97_945170 [compost metagenome]
MNVVVDQPVAVLQVLTFGNAVGGNQQIQLAFLGHVGRALFRAWREGRQYGCQIGTQAGDRSLVAAGAGDQGRLHTQGFIGPGGELLVQVARRVGKGSEDDDLAIARIDRALALISEHLAQLC